MPLTNDQINALLASSRTKGQYETCLTEFLNSDEVAINPREIWPLMFRDKSAGAMYQSFNNARKKLNGHAEDIRILSRDDEVYIFNMTKVQARQLEVAEDTSTPSTDA